MPDRPGASADPHRRRRALPPLIVLLAAPRGFCAGVRRAVAAVEEALDRFGPPVYVRRAIVHNLAVVGALEARGAVFVEELAEVPRGALVILSAHGVARSVTAEAERRGLRTVDAVCPLVAKVHREVSRHHRAGCHTVLVGHRDHPEIVGTLGQVPHGTATVVGSVADVAGLDLPPDAALAYATQTTYSVDEAAAIVAALVARFPGIAAPSGSDICYATTNRQAAVKRMAPSVEAIIVAGARFSSNACRLAEVARATGCPKVQLVADPAEVDWAALRACRSLGITAAASTPDASVSAILAGLAERFALRVEEFGERAEGAAFRPVPMDAGAGAGSAPRRRPRPL